jgi:hypothetical protein
MAFSISEFVSNVDGKGIAKACNFYIDVHPPGGVTTTDGLRFRCSAIEFPGRRTKIMNWSPIGIDFPIATGQEFNTCTIDIIQSPDLREKNLFEKWQNKAIGQASEQNVDIPDMDIGYFVNYTGTIAINQLDDQLNITKTYTLLHAYPEYILPISMDWGVDDMAKLKVSIIFYRYKNGS